MVRQEDPALPPVEIGMLDATGTTTRITRITVEADQHLHDEPIKVATGTEIVKGIGHLDTTVVVGVVVHEEIGHHIMEDHQVER